MGIVGVGATGIEPVTLACKLSRPERCAKARNLGALALSSEAITAQLPYH
jgi:hypothetical protein